MMVADCVQNRGRLDKAGYHMNDARPIRANWQMVVILRGKDVSLVDQPNHIGMAWVGARRGQQSGEENNIPYHPSGLRRGR